MFMDEFFTFINETIPELFAAYWWAIIIGIILFILLIMGIVKLIKLPAAMKRKRRDAVNYITPGYTDALSVSRTKVEVKKVLQEQAPLQEATATKKQEQPKEAAQEVLSETTNQNKEDAAKDPQEKRAEQLPAKESEQPVVAQTAETVAQSQPVQAAESIPQEAENNQPVKKASKPRAKTAKKIEEKPEEEKPVQEEVKEEEPVVTDVVKEEVAAAVQPIQYDSSPELSEEEKLRQARMAKALALAEEERTLLEKERKKKEREEIARVKKEQEEKKKLGYDGKWEIILDEGKYRYRLIASNGELLCQSEAYTTKKSCKDATQQLIEALKADRYEAYENKSGIFQLKFYSEINRLLLVGETYATKASAISAVESMKRFSQTAQFIEQTKTLKKDKTYSPDTRK